MERKDSTALEISEIYVSDVLRYATGVDTEKYFADAIAGAKKRAQTWLIVGYDGMTVRRQQNVFFVGTPSVRGGEIHVSEIRDERLARRKPYWNLVIRLGFASGLRRRIVGNFKEADATFDVDMIHAIPSDIVDLALVDGRSALDESAIERVIDVDTLPSAGVIVPRIWDPMTKKNWLPGWEIRTVESRRPGKLVWNEEKKKRELTDDDGSSFSYYLAPGNQVIRYRELFGPVLKGLEKRRHERMSDEQRRRVSLRYDSMRRVVRDRPPLVLDRLSRHMPMSESSSEFYVRPYYAFISPAVIILRGKKRTHLPRKLSFGPPSQLPEEVDALKFGSDEEEIEWLNEPESTPQNPWRLELTPVGRGGEEESVPDVEAPRLMPTETYQLRLGRSWTVYESPSTIPSLPTPRLDTKISVPSFPIITPRSPPSFPPIMDLPR